MMSFWTKSWISCGTAIDHLPSGHPRPTIRAYAAVLLGRNDVDDRTLVAKNGTRPGCVEIAGRAWVGGDDGVRDSFVFVGADEAHAVGIVRGNRVGARASPLRGVLQHL